MLFRSYGGWASGAYSDSPTPPPRILWSYVLDETSDNFFFICWFILEWRLWATVNRSFPIPTRGAHKHTWNQRCKGTLFISPVCCGLWYFLFCFISPISFKNVKSSLSGIDHDGRWYKKRNVCIYIFICMCVIYLYVYYLYIYNIYIIYIWLSHFDVQQKLVQHCKSTIL